MAISPPHLDGFERLLLRRGVGALEADRDRCADCGRTPLTGEQVHLYDGRKGGIVCELCRSLLARGSRRIREQSAWRPTTTRAPSNSANGDASRSLARTG